MKIILIILSLLVWINLQGQKVVNCENQRKGEIQLAEGISIPEINNGYTVWLPDEANITGLIVFTRSRRDTIKREFLIDYALRNQLAVLYATTDNRLEFFFDKDKLQEIENYIYEVLLRFNIPKTNLLYCGMSLEGTRALKLTIYGQSKESIYKLKPRAIAICDAPLDMVRFHKEMIKAKELNFIPTTGNEGNWVSNTLEKNLGGTPKDTLSSYIEYSPYCYIAGGGKYLYLFIDIAVRAYTEPDVNWWIETRRKDYYSMNSIDLAAFIKELKVKGNEKAELIITHDKGYHPDGKRHPHSWSIVNENKLIDWFLKEIEK